MWRGRPGAVARGLSALLLGACTGTEVGNPAEGPSVSSQLSLTALSSTDRVELLAGDAASATAVQVEQIWISLGDLRFVHDDDCSRDMDERTTLSGPIVAELVGEPTMLDVELPAGAYCRVRVPFARAEELAADEPPELEGLSLLLTGTLDGTPLQIRSRSVTELQLRSKDAPFQLDGDATSLLLAYDAAAWFEGLDLADVAPDESGVLRIDEEHERALLATFDRNLSLSLALYSDRDGNGRLDPQDEMSPAPLASAAPE